MASSFEKSVKGATKIKAAPPKTKYIEHILIATHSGEAGVGEVFRALQYRLRDTAWTVVFKSLITIHLMIREGSPDVTLAYLALHRNMLAVSMFADGQTQGRNIRHYTAYLAERARAYRESKCDWVRGKNSRLEKLTVEKGLLRETEIVQHQLTALLKCDVIEAEPENEITVTVFRLLVLDLLALFQVLNQGMINILGHFFEMSKPDAERAMEIYRTFTRQTDFVVQYLSIARSYEHHTRVEVPKLKHAPVNLGRQLEDYLRDSDFEVHRRQYLAELEAKKTKGSLSATKAAKPNPATNRSTSTARSAPPAKAPDSNLIDFFESIEQQQTPLAIHPQPQAQAQPLMGTSPWTSTAPYQPNQFAGNGFATQPVGFQINNPFSFPQQNSQQMQSPQQMQPNVSGAGFGSFTSQPQNSFQHSSLGTISQDSVASFQTGNPAGLQTLQSPPQVTNPFRQSMLMSQQTGLIQPSHGSFPSSLQQRTSTSQSTNPFTRSSPQTPQSFPAPLFNNLSFQSPPPQLQHQQPAPLQSMATGTNPFAKNFASAQPQQRPQTASGTLSPQPTGSTNPFRQSQFVNLQTGMSWQHNQQPMGGGLDNIQTIPVFPRPAQQTPWQQ